MATGGSAQAELEQRRRDLVASVRLAHAKLLELDQQLRLATVAIELRDQLRNLIARRLEHQAATALDGSLAELDLLAAVSDRAALSTERRDRYLELSSCWASLPRPSLRWWPTTRPRASPSPPTSTS